MRKQRKLIFLLLAFLIAAPFATAQSQLSKKADISFKGTTLSDFLWTLESQTGVKFICKSEDALGVKLAPLSSKGITVKAALDRAFRGSGLGYEVVDGVVTVFRIQDAKTQSAEQTQPPAAAPASQVLAKQETVSNQAPAKKKGTPATVKGHVGDKSGVALIGVAVVEPGTNNATQTDLQGDYTLKVSDGANSVLEYYYVGMETQSIPVSGRAVINVTMQEEILALEQVVVTGYSSISKESYTGSAVTVTAQKLEDRSIASIEEALRGNVAGALSASSGQPGEGGSLILRGFGSMNASNFIYRCFINCICFSIS